MTSILKDVVERGTGRNAKVEGIELAGKTGTTNDYSLTLGFLVTLHRLQLLFGLEETIIDR